MDTRDLYKLVRQLSEDNDEIMELNDSFDLELNEGFVIETGIVGFTEDGVIVHLDEDAMEYLDFHGILLEDVADNSEILNENAYQAVKSAISRRILNQHHDLLSKYGIDTVLNAIDEVADGFSNDELDEIGSSDVSIWVRHVIENLKRMQPDEPSTDLSEIKRLAFGSDELEEGWKSKVLGGAALLAAILGGNKLHYDHMLKTDPQLSALVQHLETAQERGDMHKIRELKDRIKQTYSHIQATGSPVMGPDGEPVEPKYESMNEAEYQGRKVPLNKPMQGDVKKSKVYTKKPNGKVVKVNFGDKNMRIKKSNPGRRKNFRARHNCDNPGPKWKPRYWSCKAW